jgi:hypothetical protein
MSRLPTVQSRQPAKQSTTRVEPASTDHAEEEKQTEPVAASLPPIEFATVACDLSFATNSRSASTRKNLTIRLTARQAIAMRLLLMGFEQEVGSIHGRRPNEQDWLRHVLDKVANAANVESYESNNH